MVNEYLLLIETATESCSVAVSCGDKIVAEKYTDLPKAHASLLARFIKDILEENNLTVSDLCAVAVSEGPGSYTGLRVGVSCAKGLCYGANIPLIGINTLGIIAQCAIDNNLVKPGYLIAPMIDARRMEVYTALFDSNGMPITKTEAKILDAGSYSSQLQNSPILFTGNGASKFEELLKKGHEQVYETNARFMEQKPHASGMRGAAYRQYKNKEFKDCAYFEPFYLKDFVAGKPKKLL